VISSRIYILTIVSILGLTACKGGGSGRDGSEVVAEVYDRELTRSMLMDDLEGKLSGDDSAQVVEDYIRGWVRSEILFAQAQDVLSDDEKNKDELLDQYYRDLIVHSLRQKWLSQHLDLNVSLEDIESYYEEHKSDFELKENIVKLVFFKLPKTMSNINSLWYKFNLGKKEHLDEITYQAAQNGGNFHRDEDVWLSFNDILKEIPITTYNQEGYLNNNKVISVSDSEYIYFVRILDFRVKDNISPLEREQERIQRIILNKRKSQLMKQLEDQIVEEAYSTDKVSIH